MSVAAGAAAPRFNAGDRVRIHLAHPPGHRRVPFYIRGKIGMVERYVAPFPNPEELAYGFDGRPARHLYRVRFKQKEIWAKYQGPDEDTLDLEIYEHWLEPV